MKDLKERIAAFQRDSWQLEVFISGGIVYWLYSITDNFQGFFFEVYPVSFTTSNQIILLFGAYTITRALLIGFAANLLLRAIWLAYLGINYWYPDGLNKERLPQNVAESDRISRSKSAAERLLSIERWCNLSFSFAVVFALFGFSVLVIMSGLIYVLLQFNGENFFENSLVTYTILIVLILLQLGIMDKLFYSKGSPGSRWGKFRDGLSRVLDILSLSFLFKREFLVLRTNAKRWFVYGITAIYLGLALLISINQIGAYYPFGTFNIKTFDDRTQYDISRVPEMNALRYETALTPGRNSFYGCIQSEIISDDYIKLFVVSWVNFDRYLKDRFAHYGFSTDSPTFDTQQQYDDYRSKNQLAYQRTLNDLFTVKIDEVEQGTLNWKQYVHPISKEEGYVTFIPIDSLIKKEYLLKVETRYFGNNDSIRKGLWMSIPFWKQN